MARTTVDFDTVVLPSDRALLPGPSPHRRRRPAHAAYRPPLSPIRRTIREIGFNLITAGVVVLLFVAYQLWGTGLAEAKSQNKLKNQFSAPTAAPAPGDNSTIGGPQAPVAGPPEGTAIAHMVIPKIGVDKYVVEGISDTALHEGPGHYPTTPQPGEPGNSAIAGHRTTYGAPFYDVDKLVKGDDIFVTTKAGQFHYTVDHSTIVNPSDVGVIGPTKDNRLTLTTCNPRFEAVNRLIVVALLTDLPVTPPKTLPPAPVIVKAVTLGGAGNSGAWTPTLLYGLAALALWLAVRIYASRRRNWRWVPFAVGLPLCLVPLWFVFENAIRLLPNNI